jgi:hypothetical protein
MHIQPVFCEQGIISGQSIIAHKDTQPTVWEAVQERSHQIT